MSVQDVLERLRFRKAKAADVKRDYENGSLSRAFEQVRLEAMNEWANTSADNKEGRERAYFIIQVLKLTEQKLILAIADGQAADAEQQAIERQTEGQDNG